MPIVLRIGGYKFFFFSREENEPPHIHIKHSGRIAKYWIDPVEFAHNDGFPSHELNEVSKMVKDNQPILLGKWYERFPNA